jgi:hypothetical protein
MTKPDEQRLFPQDATDQTDWVSPALAARLCGTTEAVVESLVKSGRVRTAMLGGRVHVAELDVTRAVAEMGRKGASE